MLSSMTPAGRFLFSRLIGTGDQLDKSHQPSIFSRLQRFEDGKPETLDPCPDLNAILTELVSYLQGSIKTPSCQDQPFSAVEHEVCCQIDANDTYLSRADFIRDIAARAEARLERYYALKILSTPVTIDPQAHYFEKVAVASCDFPYIGNYVSMLQKEADILLSFLNYREKSPITIAKYNVEHSSTDRDITLAFCGSGPLPFSGILLALYLRINVILIDIDEEAAMLSNKVIRLWEKLGIIPCGKVKVVCANCGDLKYRTPQSARAPASKSSNSIYCDVVFVAALIPDDVKEQMFERISKEGENSPLVVIRTAHGLTARLAYSVAKRRKLTNYLELVGMIAPKTHKLDNGFVVGDTVKPLDYFSSEILNSLEIYSW